jgi:CRISPR/Cas system-associated endonuclease/helicase Cas3
MAKTAETLPFAVEQPRYNAETEAAMRECDEMLASGNFVSLADSPNCTEETRGAGADLVVFLA